MGQCRQPIKDAYTQKGSAGFWVSVGSLETILELGGRMPAEPIPQAITYCQDPVQAANRLAMDLGKTSFAFVLVFVTPPLATPDFAKALTASLGDMPVIGCTTAGEIGPEGYTQGSAVALGFPKSSFAVAMKLIHPIKAFSICDGARIGDCLATSSGFNSAVKWPYGFGLLLTDGLSYQEDALVSAMATALGTVPVIGGSAGDGLDFRKSCVLYQGQWYNGAAVVLFVRTCFRLQSFRLDHFQPTARKMVVTKASPCARLVHEINAEPAALEYARIIGKNLSSLSPLIFAEHPVLVRFGDTHHIRAIQKVENNGDLRFFSAIDEGLVLRVAESGNIALHLEKALQELCGTEKPALILGFDCILRRLEAEQKQLSHHISAILQQYNLRGFNTYGEQFGATHVNQTLTGIAFFLDK